MFLCMRVWVCVSLFATFFLAASLLPFSPGVCAERATLRLLPLEGEFHAIHSYFSHSRDAT